MKLKRLISWLLASALAASLAVMPIGAAGTSSFGDISDRETAVNADILRLMGVVSGTGGNQFNPNGTLTRAEFCTMVVKFMQQGDQVPIHATRTIFSDVTSKHWAQGYVNLAASLTVKDGEREVPLISGVGDGRFQPDEKITQAQAATILIRVLGYSSEQAGAVWPQSYMNLAESIGLSDGLPSDYNAALTRGQAAQLFVNALSCKNGEGSDYYTTLGKAQEDTIILAVNVETDDGTSDGAIRTTANKESEAYLPAEGEGNPYALQGKRGALVLNDKDEIVTFVPDDSSATTIILSGDAQPSYVKASGGSQYTMSKDTLLYTADATEGKSYMEGYSVLKSGTQITMYSERGKIVAVYASGSASSIDSDAVVVMGSPSTAMFHQLTGGATNFNIQKGRQTITMSQIQPYDVVTYDSMSNTLIVSDLRLTCIYENASPNSKAPTEIEVLGHTFEVLDSAWEMTGDYKVGDQVTLLLTADGKVAGMAAPSGKTRSTAIGMVDSGKATVFLPNGGTLELSGTISNADNLANQLVTISSGAKGKISASKLSSKSTSGQFLVEEGKLGSYTVSAGVQIYEQVSGGAMVKLDSTSLNMASIPGEKIATYHLNTSNYVDYIVLDRVTGNAYKYGMLIARTTVTEAEKDDEGNVTNPEKESRSWYLTNHSTPNCDSASSLGNTGFAGKNGTMAGVARGANNRVVSIIELEEIKSVSPSDFFESQGVQYVNAGGRTYRVADEVECCRDTGSIRDVEDSWFSQDSGEERLAAIKAFSSDLTIYVDPIGDQVRVISAK
ncbi:S-layer protein [uncultured Clostridium sp.]|nr:S-layer protein [uncultured Clostridium sp.]